MKIRYDPEADAMYIKINESKVEKTKKIDKNTLIDYDKQGKVIGFELLSVKENNPNLLKELQVEMTA